ncbi:PREDICTED: cytokine-dependent hematopoietic cell linker [Elephantulus edwardii]|uniref:cytokine-dependent hematopoietic cell linker n=1 Tax=Elephantulus edwardii TaxID=28737 RepID=UPI0003F0EDA6|nr:PREDICTED: cytokine-dependent hematopoietic cell linker [Elephantulus edwardii]
MWQVVTSHAGLGTCRCNPGGKSWPRLHTVTGQYHTIDEHLPNYDKNFEAVLGGAKGQEDKEYEDPELQMVGECQPIKILPARPIKESEYADTRYFKHVMDLPVDTTVSMPIEGKHWKTPGRLAEINKVSEKHIKGIKTPLPPPRPLITLPKKYQPLPPEPENSKPFPLRHTFPETRRGPRQISFKDLSEVLGTEKVSHLHMKPEPSPMPQTQNTQETPLPVSRDVAVAVHGGIDPSGEGLYYAEFLPFLAKPSDTNTTNKQSGKKFGSFHKGSLQSYSLQPCQSPVSHVSRENKLTYKNMNWKNLGCPTRLDEKDVQHHDWYIGEHSRQEVEEALMRENKDGTFLVRDCSSKSSTEPYVLVVFHGSKVYNVKIRFLEGNQQFALGTGLRGNEKFDSVEDIIEHYKYFPITLIDGKDRTGIHREQCFLTQPLSFFPQ